MTNHWSYAILLSRTIIGEKEIHSLIHGHFGFSGSEKDATDFIISQTLTRYVEQKIVAWSLLLVERKESDSTIEKTIEPLVT